MERKVHGPRRGPAQGTTLRYPQSKRVEIRDPAESQVIEAQVTNVSRNGVGLVSKDFIDAGVQIMFAFGDQYVYARVRHCHPVENGFVIGAAIGDMTCC